METVKQIEAALAARIEGSREALANARAVFRQLEAEEQRLTRSLRALNPENPLVSGNGTAAAAKPKPRLAKKQQVSEALVERVFAVVADHGDAGATLNMVADRIGVSPSAVSFAIKELRARERVRLAGVANTRGKPKLYRVY
jgi:DNA-binding transcriptional ArsR family regulator